MATECQWHLASSCSWTTWFKCSLLLYIVATYNRVLMETSHHSTSYIFQYQDAAFRQCTHRLLTVQHILPYCKKMTKIKAVKYYNLWVQNTITCYLSNFMKSCTYVTAARKQDVCVCVRVCVDSTITSNSLTATTSLPYECANYLLRWL